MTKTVASCRPDANLAAATALMWEHNCGLLPVVNEPRKLSGVITDRDIAIALGTRDRRACEIRVSDVVYRAAVFCYADDDVRSALRIMAAERVRRLPVVNRDGYFRKSDGQRQRASRNHVDDPYGYCLPPGVPRIDFGGGPFKILQTPGVTAILYETLVGMIFRQVFTDGRPPAPVDSPTCSDTQREPG